MKIHFIEDNTKIFLQIFFNGKEYFIELDEQKLSQIFGKGLALNTCIKPRQKYLTMNKGKVDFITRSRFPETLLDLSVTKEMVEKDMYYQKLSSIYDFDEMDELQKLYNTIRSIGIEDIIEIDRENNCVKIIGDYGMFSGESRRRAYSDYQLNVSLLKKNRVWVDFEKSNTPQYEDSSYYIVVKPSK